MFAAPFQVDFDITLQCMYKCKHCNVSAGEKLKDEMTEFQIKSVLDQLDNLGISDVSITGGEPLLRKDCLEILRYASTKEGSKLTLNTNGLLVNDQVVRFLEKNCPNILIAVSLDGYNPSTYSVLRRLYSDSKKVLENEFYKVVESLKRLANSNLSVSVNYTVTSATLKNFWETYDFIKNIGVQRMLAIKFFPYGEGRINREQLELNYNEWSNFLKDATRRKMEDPYYKGLHVSVTCPWEMYLPLINVYSIERIGKLWSYNSPLESELYRSKRTIGCHAGITSCAISPNGDVYPCGTISSKFPPFVCGNLKENSFEYIWKNSNVLNSLRSLDITELEGKCQDCELVNLCGGGCRARAFTEFFSLTAPDYLCPVQLICKEGDKFGNVDN